MKIPANYRLGFWRAVFFLIMAVGLVFTTIRFVSGLGAVTNLTDEYPWGLWKAFNVVAGVGIGGAGFTIMGVVYIFNAKNFRAVVRPTVLMAFLAYFSVAVALFIDIGRSWTIWHPIIMWNHASVLFEVSWCLMLYTGVLMLEGSGMFFEKMGWNRLVKIQHAVTLPIVIVGVVLSTVHQSSLGSLFLIVPGKLHALWYTQMLPVLFFVSAICVGLAMILVLSRITARAFNRRLEMPVMTELARILLAVITVYGITRLMDLWVTGSLVEAFRPTYEAGMFWAEFLLLVPIPFAILATPRRRSHMGTLYAGGLCVVAGFSLNRLNVCITGFEAAQGGSYVPSVGEIAIGLMVIAMCFAIYRLAVQYLPVYPEVKIPETGFRILKSPARERTASSRPQAVG